MIKFCSSILHLYNCGNSFNKKAVGDSRDLLGERREGKALRDEMHREAKCDKRVSRGSLGKMANCHETL